MKVDGDRLAVSDAYFLSSVSLSVVPLSRSRPLAETGGAVEQAQAFPPVLPRLALQPAFTSHPLCSSTSGQGAEHSSFPGLHHSPCVPLLDCPRPSALGASGRGSPSLVPPPWHHLSCAPAVKQSDPGIARP